MGRRTPNHTPLANLRRTRTLTQAQLARIAGVSPQTIAKVEAGKLNLRVDVQSRLAAILGVSRSELFPEETQAVA